MSSTPSTTHVAQSDSELIANVFGVLVNRDTLTVALDDIWSMVWLGRATGHTYTVMLANAFSVVEANRNPAHAEALREADLVLADGWPAAKMARTERIAGADLMLAAARHPELGKMRHVLLGGFGVAYKAALRQWDESRTKTIRWPWIPEVDTDQDLVDWVNMIGADILWVALGCPKQEIWMHENRQKLNARVVIGVGAAFDFLAGRVRRAPVWVQKTGLEWAWRILQEPRRWRRQVGAAVGFVRLLLR